jgi:hypothetical protein
MPSRSLQKWRSTGRDALREIEAAHRSVGRGHAARFAAQQLTQAYVLLLSSHFQRFCRDLHSECADHLVNATTSTHIAPLIRARFTEARKLNIGNPNPGNIGSDFAHFGMDVWAELRACGKHNANRQKKLQRLCDWRNAVAHHDFRKPALQGRTELSLSEVRDWRAACHGLAVDLDRVMASYLMRQTNVAPW